MKCTVYYQDLKFWKMYFVTMVNWIQLTPGEILIRTTNKEPIHRFHWQLAWRPIRPNLWRGHEISNRPCVRLRSPCPISLGDTEDWNRLLGRLVHSWTLLPFHAVVVVQRQSLPIFSFTTFSISLGRWGADTEPEHVGSPTSYGSCHLLGLHMSKPT